MSFSIQPGRYSFKWVYKYIKLHFCKSCSSVLSCLMLRNKPRPWVEIYVWSSCSWRFTSWEYEPWLHWGTFCRSWAVLLMIRYRCIVIHLCWKNRKVVGKCYWLHKLYIPVFIVQEKAAWMKHSTAQCFLLLQPIFLY